MFTAKCPKCFSRLSLEDDQKNTSQKCPSCGISFTPSGGSPPADPQPVETQPAEAPACNTQQYTSGDQSVIPVHTDDFSPEINYYQSPVTIVDPSTTDIQTEEDQVALEGQVDVNTLVGLGISQPHPGMARPMFPGAAETDLGNLTEERDPEEARKQGKLARITGAQISRRKKVFLWVAIIGLLLNLILGLCLWPHREAIRDWIIGSP